MHAETATGSQHQYILAYLLKYFKCSVKKFSKDVVNTSRIFFPVRFASLIGDQKDQNNEKEKNNECENDKCQEMVKTRYGRRKKHKMSKSRQRSA